MIPPNALFSAFAFISFVLAAVPLPWHIKSCNTGSSMYILWTSIGCLILFVNSIVWNDNVINSAPVWCDISAHYFIGANVGIRASSLCIIRRIYLMTKLQMISADSAQRRRDIVVDLSIGIGLPCIVMALYYIVQSNRFVIYEQLGCYPSVDNTPLAYFLVFMWPLIIGLTCLVYAVFTFRRAFLQKEQLKKMHHAGFSISSGRYWRLMALCSMGVIFTVPMNLYIIITNAISQRPTPYVSWASVHSDFSNIPQYPTVIWKSLPDAAALGLETIRWSYILCALVFFAFFGWAQEARDVYYQAFWSACHRLGYSKPSTSCLPTMVSKGKRQLAYMGKQTGHDVDQQMESKYVSTPVQARVKRDFARTSITFEPAPSSETLPRFPALCASEYHMHITSASLPTAPEPVLARNRRSADVSPLV